MNKNSVNVFSITDLLLQCAARWRWFVISVFVCLLFAVFYLMNNSYFKTVDDISDPTVQKKNGQKMYFVGSGDFPFAFYLEGANINDFKNTVLKPENEGRRIDQFFPGFLDWSRSNGESNADWYLYPTEK